MNPHFITEPDATFCVIENDLPSKDSIDRWRDYLSEKLPRDPETHREKYKELHTDGAQFLAKLLHFAWLGIQKQVKARAIAKSELAEMLRSLARQIDPQQEKLEGTLEVGTNDRSEVVVNLDHDRTGHIIFSPEQANGFAESLLRKAHEAVVACEARKLL